MHKTRFFRLPELLIFLVIISAAVSCQKDNKNPDYKYFVEVTSEKSTTKESIVKNVQDMVKGFDISIPEELLLNLFNDSDISVITYKTKGIDGKKIIVSGIVAIPSGITSYTRLLSVQHATCDIGSAPSEQDFYYELLPVLLGKVVVLADYIGYGVSQTSDMQHPYLHSKITGTTCADMIEAAREYLKSKSIEEKGDTIDLAGYSQGGSSTISTLLELEKRGKLIGNVYAGAGAYDLENQLQEVISAGSADFAYPALIPFLMRGLIYGDRLNVSDEKIYHSDIITNGTNKLFSTLPPSKWNDKLGKDVTKILHPDFYASPSYNNNGDVIKLIKSLKENSVINSTTQPKAKITFYHSKNDEIVYYSNSVNAHAKWTNSTLINLTLPGHELGGVEFYLRYNDIWDVIIKYLVGA